MSRVQNSMSAGRGGAREYNRQCMLLKPGERCIKIFRAITLAHTTRIYELNRSRNMSNRKDTVGLVIRVVTLVCAFAASAASSRVAWAETPTPVARIEIGDTTVRRGSDKTVRVVTEWPGEPAALIVVPIEYPEIEGAEWHSQHLASERDGDTNRVIQTASLTVITAAKSATIPEMAVVYRVPGEEDEHEIRTDPVLLVVQSAALGAPLAVGIVLTAVSVSIAVWLAARMRRRQRAGGTGPAATETADLLGRDLNSLRRLRLAGDYGAYFMGLVRIAREIDPAALDQAPLSDVAAMIESARYGGYRPDKDLAERAYRAVERLLKRVQNVQAAEEE